MVERNRVGKRVPNHCLHRPSRRGYVRLGGRTHHTEPWGSQESRERYEQLHGEWLA